MPEFGSANSAFLCVELIWLPLVSQQLELSLRSLGPRRTVLRSATDLLGEAWGGPSTTCKAFICFQERSKRLRCAVGSNTIVEETIYLSSNSLSDRNNRAEQRHDNDTSFQPEMSPRTYHSPHFQGGGSRRTFPRPALGTRLTSLWG